MPRVKRGLGHAKKRRKLLKAVKGYKWGRKNLIRLAKTARTKAGAHAYRGRRQKKRTMRGLWQMRLNAFLRREGWSYSRFMGALKANQIIIDRKILADLAVNAPVVLKGIIAKIKK